AAHHAHAPARMQGQIDVGQEQAFAAAQGEISERDHPDSLPGCTAGPTWGNVGIAPVGARCGEDRMAMNVSVQVAAWLHSQVVAGARVDQVLPAMARQGFTEVQVRQLYNAVLTDPDGFKAGFSRAAAGQPPVAHTLPS